MSRIYISLNERTLELEGDNEFIEQKLDLLKKLELIPNRITSTADALEHKESSGVNQGESKNSTKVDIATEFPNVFHVSGDSFDILAEPKVGSKAEKTRALALLYLYAKKMLSGNDSVESNELRVLADKFGCLDVKNFASQMSAAKPNITESGKKGSSNKVYTITVPGVNAARKLANEMNGLGAVENA